MRFDIITIFPHIFDSYFNESILARARKKNLVNINIHDLRDYTSDKHRKAAPACATRKRCGRVDDKPYGGGAGMVLKVEPIFKAVIALVKSQISNPKSQIKSKTKNPKSKRRIILFSAKGRAMTQADVRRWAKYSQLIMICGRYEGIDERVAEYVADEEVSVGNYILTGGEIPAMIVVDAVSRLIPGVLGKKESLKEESFGSANGKWQMANGKKTISHKPLATSYLEYPQYTRPEDFKGWKVPKVLLGGNHRKIEEWRKKRVKSVK